MKLNTLQKKTRQWDRKLSWKKTQYEFIYILLSPKFILLTIFKIPLQCLSPDTGVWAPALPSWSAFLPQIEIMPSSWLLIKNPDSHLFAGLALNFGPHTSQLCALLLTDMYPSFKDPLCFPYPVSHSTLQLLQPKQHFPSPLCTVCTTVNIYYYYIMALFTYCLLWSKWQLWGQTVVCFVVCCITRTRRICGTEWGPNGCWMN